MKTLIIAEVGVNHNGDMNLAKVLIDAAHQAGADIVKFQTFNASSLVTETAKQASYQSRNAGKEESQFDMLKRLELSHSQHVDLKGYCDRLGLEFLSTAFDDDSLDFLVNDIGVKRLKIPSGEITNAPFLLRHAQTGANLIMSTGMANLSEIEQALGVLAFGMLNPITESPSRSAFLKAYGSSEGQALLKQRVTLLHCTSDYPAPIEQINLEAINTLRSAFGLPVGYSDHSAGITVPIAAATMNASVIEKHFTLDRNLPGPDHKASLEPDELQRMVQAIRDVELAKGDGVKRPTLNEFETMSVARKSLVAARNIRIGQRITVDDVAVKRPGDGMSPFLLWELIGKVSQRNYQPGDLFDE
ncbi:MAG: N-acetylneuraminate synthase [Idiomarinaceae bacterium]|nr:N-acetylneuraminate synthase [Idiomarinaceae bacterium]